MRVTKKLLQPLVTHMHQPERDRERFYAQLGKRPRNVFPLKVAAEDGLTLGAHRGVARRLLSHALIAAPMTSTCSPESSRRSRGRTPTISASSPRLDLVERHAAVAFVGT
jgi:hypothetical protein